MKIGYEDSCGNDIKQEVKSFILNRLESYDAGQLENIENTQSNIVNAIGHLCDALSEKGILRSEDIVMIGMGFVPDNTRLLK